MSERFLSVPPTLRHLMVPRSVVERTRELLAGPGAEELEAVVLWIGHVTSAIEAHVTDVYFPRQIAYRAPDGLAVEIPVEERTSLALSLPIGLVILAKIHTHAGAAYHSDVDAANPYLNHEGAVAITVPYLARAPLGDLSTCSVNVFHHHRWRELAPADVRHFIGVIDEEPG